MSEKSNLVSIPTNAEKMLSKEAAAYLLVTPGTLDQLCFRRRIRYVRFGRHRIFYKKDLDAFLGAHSREIVNG